MSIEQKRGIGVAAGAPAVCPLCEREGLMERHCKVVCEHCGYVESCEDNFAPMSTAPIHAAPDQ